MHFYKSHFFGKQKGFFLESRGVFINDDTDDTSAEKADDKEVLKQKRRSADYLLQKIKKNSDYEFTSEEKEQLEELKEDGDPETSRKAKECLQHAEEKNLKGILALMRKDKVNPKSYADVILGTPAPKVIKEASEKLTYEEKRNPMRRYVNWLWKLSRDSKYEIDVRGFVRDYFNAELLKNIGGEASGVAGALQLWAKGNIKEETEEVTNKRITQYEKRQRRVWGDERENKKNGAEAEDELFEKSDADDIRLVLKDPKNTALEWNVVISSQIVSVADNLSREEFLHLLAVLKNPPTGKETKVRSFLKREVTPKTLAFIKGRFGDEVEQETIHVLRTAIRRQAGEPYEITESAVNNTKIVGTLLEECQKDDYVSQVGSVDIKSAQNNLEKMADVIRGAGFDDEIMKKVGKIVAEQKEEIESQKGVDVGNERRRKEEMYFAAQEGIRREIENAREMGAQEMKEVIGRMREVLRIFILETQDAVFEAFAQGAYREQTGKEASGFVLKRTESLLKKAEALCNTALSGQSDEEIVDKLHQLDASESEEENIDNSRRIVKALLRYSEKIDAEAPQKRSEQQKDKEYLQDALGKYFGMNENKRFDAAIEEIEEIAEKANVEVGYIREALAQGEVPETYCYGVVQEWAKKYGIPFSEATEVIQSLSPSADIVFLGRLGKEGFLRKALENEYPDDAKMLYKWYRKKQGTFAKRFAQSGGTMKKYLLERAEDDVMSAANTVMDLFADKTLSEDITEEKMKEKYEEAMKSAKPIVDAVKPFSERAGKLVEDLKLIRESVPKDKEEETIDARDEIFHMEKELERIAKLSNPDQKFDVSALDRYDFLKDIARLTGKTADVLKKVDPSKIAGYCEAFISAVEKRRDEYREMPSEQQLEALRKPMADFSENLESMREREKTLEEKRKEKLQQFANWVVGKNPNEDIRNLVESLENLNGKRVLVRLSDEEFDKKHRKKAKAMVILRNGSFQIHVREQDWNSNSLNLELETSMRHEGFHALDAANKKEFSKKLDKRLRDSMEKEDYKSFREEFCATLHITDKSEFPDEIFAYLMAGDDPKIQQLISKIPKEIYDEFLDENEKEKYAKDFANKGIKVGFFGGTERHARSAAADVSFDPATKEHWKFELQTQIDRLENTLDSLKKSSVQLEGKDEFISDLEQALSNFKEDVSAPISNDDKYQELFDQIGDSSKGFNAQAESALIKLAENQESETSFFQDVWGNTTFLSISDLISMFNTTKEFIERRHQRNQKSRTGKAGKALFDKLIPSLANEFDVKREEAEVEEVGNYEKGIQNKDGWQIMERVAETTNKDELKACLNVLSKNGQIDWYDRRIWQAMERVGSGIHILESDANDVRALKIKLQRSCAILWDNDYFNTTDKTNGGSFQSKKGEYEQDIAGNVQQMGGMLESLLQQKRNGGNVDPQKYEAYLEKCIDIGKSTPEDVMWYLIQGVHHGILNMERVNYLDYSKLNNYPPIEWFYNKRPKLAEVRKIAEMFPPENGRPPASFNDWFMTTIMADKSVRERNIKSAIDAGSKWDHDWATTMFAVGNTSSAWQVLNSYLGKPAMHLTAYPNMTIGQLTYTTDLARYKDRYSKKELKSEIVRQLSFSTVFSMALQGNYQDEKTHSLTSDELRKSPRSNTKTVLYKSDESLTTEEILQSSDSILRAIDPRVFGFIGTEDISDPKKAQEIARNINQVEGYEGVLDLNRINNGRDLLDSLSDVIERALDVNPDGVDRFVAKARQVYASHHGGDERLGKIDDDRGMNWEQHARESLGNKIVDNFGMYNR